MPGVPKAASAWQSKICSLADSAGLFSHLSVQRLRTRAQFRAVVAGARVATTSHFALHRCALLGTSLGNDLIQAGFRPHALFFSRNDVWLGALVPKRWAKRAVTRNTIRRQILAVSSAFEFALPFAAHVVRLRREFDRARFMSASSASLKLALRQELVQLFASATQDSTVSMSPGLPR